MCKAPLHLEMAHVAAPHRVWKASRPWTRPIQTPMATISARVHINAAISIRIRVPEDIGNLRVSTAIHMLAGHHVVILAALVNRPASWGECITVMPSHSIGEIRSIIKVRNISKCSRQIQADEVVQLHEPSAFDIPVASTVPARRSLAAAPSVNARKFTSVWTTEPWASACLGSPTPISPPPTTKESGRL